MIDGKGRLIDYMRISVTDRCNLRCRYCMPDGIRQIAMSEILTYEEIERICQIAAELGIKKLKITGGEPLVRKGCTDLIRRLKKVPGIEQVTLTTNGVLLTEYLESLKKAGTDGINISLDTCNSIRYQAITGMDACDRVIEAVHKSAVSGIRTNVNAVLQEDNPEGEVCKEDIKGLLDLSKETAVDVRFIELMPIGYGKKRHGVSNDRVLSEIRKIYPEIKRDERTHGNGPAVYYQIPGFSGSIGFISAMHGKFCRECNRIRMTATGDIKPCLCYADVYPLRDLLRSGNYELVKEQLTEAVRKKPEAHCFEEPGAVTEEHQMVQIGG